MAALIAQTLLPLVALVLAAVALPRFLIRALGPGPGALMLNACLSALALTLIAGAGFLALYALQDPRSLVAAGRQPLAAARHFATLGGMAGLVWAPVMLAALLAPPRR